MKIFFLPYLVIFLMIACNTDHKRVVVFTKDAPAPIGPYSQGIKSGGSLFVSGQIALDASGKFDTSSIENETKQVLENIKAVVEAGGMKLSDVAKATIYCTDLKNFKRINDIYKTYFPENPPARETIEVRGLPKGAHVEISVIAK